MISVVILTKNEEEMIEACLKSVAWADEIIIIDSDSEDNTLKIAKKYTDKINPSTLSDFAERRNLGMEKAKGEWVLFVDADERVLLPLKEEIEKAINDNNFSAYAISRRNIIFGREVKYGPFWPDWVVRLLKKSDFESWIGAVHEYPKFKGKLSYSRNSLLHLTHRNIDQIVLKSLNWSNIDANLRLEANHPKMSGWRFLRILFSEMINQGLFRGGFFNGTIGAMDSILQTFSLLITYIRLWEKQQSEPRKVIYEEIDKKLVEDGFKY